MGADSWLQQAAPSKRWFSVCTVGGGHPTLRRARAGAALWSCGRDPHLRVRLHSTVELTKPHPCQTAARPSATLESASSPRRLGRSWSVPTAQARRRCQVQDLRTSAGAEDIVRVRGSESTRCSPEGAGDDRHRTVLTAQHKTPSGRETGDPTGDGRAGSRDTSASGAVATTVSPLIPYPKPPPLAVCFLCCLWARPSRTQGQQRASIPLPLPPLRSKATITARMQRRRGNFGLAGGDGATWRGQWGPPG